MRWRFCFLQQNGRGEHGERDLKRDQMEKLVREELERWDSEASMNRGDASPAVSRAPTAKSSRGSPSRASQASAASVRTVSFNDHKMRIITCLVRFSTCNFFFFFQFWIITIILSLSLKLSSCVTKYIKILTVVGGNCQQTRKNTHQKNSCSEHGKKAWITQQIQERNGWTKLDEDWNGFSLCLLKTC